MTHYTLLSLPLGARLQRAELNAETFVEDAASSDLFQLTVPPLRFFSLEVEPTVFVRVRVEADRVCLSVAGARVDGAFAESLNLNERFCLTGETFFTADGIVDGGEHQSIVAETTLWLSIDPPPPFSRLPARLLHAVGQGVVCRVLVLLQRVFLAALAEDFRKWAASGGERQPTT